MSSTWNAAKRQQKLARVIAAGRLPAAVTFLDAPPGGVSKFDGTEPSCCSFGRLAAAGRTFYTVLENHFHGAVGAWTHSIAAPGSRLCTSSRRVFRPASLLVVAAF